MQPITDDEQNQLIVEYHNAAFRERGRIINQTILLERCIDFYISCHFCNTPQLRREISDLIMCTERINFSAKLHIFQNLITKHDKAFLKANAKLPNQLETIMKKRNNFAHWQLDSSLSAARNFRATTELTLLKFTNGLEKVKWDKKKLDDHYKIIYDSVVTINKLNQKWA